MAASRSVGGGAVTDTVSGTPQGSPISPLLANVALHQLDAAWSTAGRTLGVLVRYADDFVVVCPTRDRAEQARVRAVEILATLGLVLHPDKTRIVCLTQGQAGFDFLGFHHHKVESWRKRGRWYLQRWPSERAMRSLRARVKAVTTRSYVGLSLEVVIGRLNPGLRGWGAYFRHGNSARKFAAIDSYVHQRLARFASDKHGLSGINWHNRYNGNWLRTLGVYRLTGTVRHQPVHALR